MNMHEEIHNRVAQSHFRFSNDNQKDNLEKVL